MNFHYPGYNYLGPGTSDFSRKPINQLDEAAREHDISYGDIGTSAYYTYNPADEKFLEDIKDIDTFASRIGEAVFTVKKKLSDYRIIPRSNQKNKKMVSRRRTRGTKRRATSIRRKYKRLSRMRMPRLRMRFARKRRVRTGGNEYGVKRRRAPKRTPNTNIYRILDSGSMTNTQNTKSFYVFELTNYSVMDTYATNVKYLDVTDAGTTTTKTMDMTASGTGSNLLKFTKLLKFIRFRNNNTAPVKICFYWVTPRATRAYSASSELLSSINVAYNAAEADLLDTNIYYQVGDAKGFLQHYKITKKEQGILNSGREKTVALSCLPFLFNARDSALNQEYEKKWYRALIVTIEGVVYHSAGAPSTNIGTSESQIDWTSWCEAHFAPNNKPMNTFYTISGGYDTVTAGEFADEQEGKMETYEV